jgi:UDP-GlcNAc:undecaprenyl-phosphate GlcNAc-1-phosphate transferase
MSFIFTLIVKRIAIKFEIVDKPNQDRKIHKNVVPLAGGLAVFLSCFFVLFFLQKDLLVGNLEVNHWLGVFIGSLFLIIGGLLDDKYNLKPGKQIIWPIIAVICVVMGGVEIEKITNPFGDGFIFLNTIKIPVISLFGLTHYFVLISDLLIMFWLMGMMYTTKLLDGLDGLVSGVTTIGALIIFMFTISAKYYQPDIAIASLVLASTCFGFLILNWHPAKIFLGEGGSLFLGFFLGVLAIISGGKFAIALLVMGIPILDVAWTIVRRIRQGHNPFKISDRQHLHFRLLDLGTGQRKTVLIYYFFSSVFGASALFLQSFGKVFLFFFMLFLMSAIIISFSYIDKKQSTR